MKLRNKADGRVKEFGIDETKVQPYYLRDELGNICWFKTLSEITEDWEDYEEPKTFFSIYYDGTVSEFKDGDDEQIRDMKAIGNYFDTLEEAKKAVEKLKAWKRLIDKGFRFDYVDEYENLCGNGFEIPVRGIMPAGSYRDRSVLEDLQFLFGGEE